MTEAKSQIVTLITPTSRNYKPPSLRDLVIEHVMGDVWLIETPFSQLTGTLKIVKYFEIPLFYDEDFFPFLSI